MVDWQTRMGPKRAISPPVTAPTKAAKKYTTEVKGPMSLGSSSRSGAASGASTATVNTAMLEVVSTASIARVVKMTEGFIWAAEVYRIASGAPEKP